MSATLDNRWETSRRRIEDASALTLRVIFGSRLGFTLFLGTLCVLGLNWRIGVFITDNYTLANAMAALGEGHLAVEEAVYGTTLETNGMGEVAGKKYGRNYGQLVFALPVLWALEGMTLVVDPGIVFPMLWSLLVVLLGVQVGRLVDRPSLGASAGAVCGLAAFLLHVAFARPLSTGMLPLAALQLSTILATGLAAATLYRFLARIHGGAIGLAGAISLVAATPVGFWGSIPKRHVLVVVMLVCVCYAFYRAREAPSPDALLSPLGFRALSYGLVGLMTWLNPGEAFAIFVALVLVDVPTAPSNDRRAATTVILVFFVSMIPFFATNVAISGDPLRPPRMLTKFGSLTGDVGMTGGGGSDGWITIFADSVLLPVLPAVVAGPAAEAVNRVDLLIRPFVLGTETVLYEPEAVYRTFVRSGYLREIAEIDLNQAINLSFLESAPLAAGISGVVGTVVARSVSIVDGRDSSGLRSSLRSSRDVFQGWIRTVRTDPLVATDAFVVAVAVLFTTIYQYKLPNNAQVTVRYLLPLVPLALYGIARQLSIRRAFDAHWRTALWTYAAGVLVGAQLFLVLVATASLGRGEAFQVHALLGLGVAGVLAVLAAAGVFTDDVDRVTMGVAGLAAALGTDFLLLSGLVYFQYGQYALPAVGRLAEYLAVA